MLAYAVGRIGCQVAGDGDWGVYNSAYSVNTAGKIVPGDMGRFNQTLLEHGNFFLSQFGKYDAVPSCNRCKTFIPPIFAKLGICLQLSP